MVKSWLVIAVSGMINEARTESVGDKLSGIGCSGLLINFCVIMINHQHFLGVN